MVSGNLWRTAPALLIASGALGLSMALAGLFVEPRLGRPGDPLFLFSGAVMVPADLLLALGLATLATGPAARHGKLKTAGVVLMLASSFPMVIAEALLRVSFTLGNSVFGILGPIQALGLIVFGMAVVLTGRWSSWRRFALVGFGVYVPAVMLPTLIITQGDSLLALAGYHLCVVAVGVAAFIESRAPARVPATAAR